MSTMELRKRGRATALDTATKLLANKQNTAPSSGQWVVTPKQPENENQLVSFLVRTVTSPAAYMPVTISLAEDLGTIEKAAKVIIEAVSDGTLTAPEGDAVLTLLTENFTARRVNRIFERISNTPKFEWVMTRARSAHER